MFRDSKKWDLRLNLNITGIVELSNKPIEKIKPAFRLSWLFFDVNCYGKHLTNF